MDESGLVQIKTRVPIYLYESVRSLADRNDRSLSGELLIALTEHVERELDRPSAFARAHQLTAKARARGELVAGACEHAGPDCWGKVLAHHDDYRRPLEVRWLCRRHHARWHAEHGQGANR